MVEQVLVPVLIMVGATLLVMLAVPLGFLAVSGLYFARRTASWLVPLIRRSAADARRSALDSGARLVHGVVHSRLPQALVTGAVGCALALPALAAPARDMDHHPQQEIGGLAGGDTEPAAQIGGLGGLSARPADEQGANQVRSGPASGQTSTARPVTPVDQCVGSCGRPVDQPKTRSKSDSKSDSKGKSKDKAGKKSKPKD